MFRKKTAPELPPPSKLDRLSERELIDALEANLSRSSDLFRGLSHSEIDRGWTLALLADHLETAEEVVKALQRKWVVLQSL